MHAQFKLSPRARPQKPRPTARRGVVLVGPEAAVGPAAGELHAHHTGTCPYPVLPHLTTSRAWPSASVRVQLMEMGAGGTVRVPEEENALAGEYGDAAGTGNRGR